MDDLASIATGRSHDFFAEDVRRSSEVITNRFQGQRVLVLGGAGSIGSSTVGLLSQFDPACLHIVDQNENALAELVRDLRSRKAGLRVSDFRTLPIDLGSPLMLRFLRSERPYDWVLNFAAIKHVRSEKDVFSILQMFDTNLVKPAACWRWIRETGSSPSYFSVSTDKAAEPVNLMGASKRLMEHMMFCEQGPMSVTKRVTSARFANVAFSNGSLLESFLIRLEKSQPLACPRETDRFFISLREAGQICMLAAACGPDRRIVIPRLDAQADARRIEAIAVTFLRRKGLEPEIYQDEESARANVARDLAHDRYPLLLTELDTMGEKSCETFVGRSEDVEEFDMASVLAVRYRPVEPQILKDFMSEIASMIASPDKSIGKSSIVEAVSRVVPEFHHRETARTLDSRM